MSVTNPFLAVPAKAVHWGKAHWPVVVCAVLLCSQLAAAGCTFRPPNPETTKREAKEAGEALVKAPVNIIGGIFEIFIETGKQLYGMAKNGELVQLGPSDEPVDGPKVRDVVGTPSVRMSTSGEGGFRSSASGSITRRWTTTRPKGSNGLGAPSTESQTYRHNF